MKKPKGGRGKRASYQTSVVRVPNPVMPQVLELINQFHSTQNSFPSKPTSIKKISALSVTKFYEMFYSESIEEDSEYIFQCDLIDEIIWQIDNTFIGASLESADITVDLLVKYDLIELPKNNIAATVSQFIEWLFGQEMRLYNIEEVIISAISEGRYDIILALGILDKPPINRFEYWHHTYRSQLGKLNVDYWQWKNNPESREIASELTLLLDKIPEPNQYAKLVLMQLADGKDPFLKVDKPNNPYPFTSFEDWSASGYFAQDEDRWKKRESFRASFVNWHNNALLLIGRQKLLQVYKVVFNCRRSIIEAILQPTNTIPPKPVTGKREWWLVLNVSQYATYDEVKAAYKKLAAMWHPDRNKSPSATQIMQEINAAMDEYKCRWQNL
ncbi:J domain-containing protein [Calothrix sp. CCY 0018]|uniref:J domain-containing protein n=1 Tax=Calothrix sp. CCY 0018 TaxID=3103864 RepID=UPI0039C75344